MEPIVAINKPVGPTSHDVVLEIRKITGVKKVGHAGTLDPLASGVLVIGIGKGTKLLTQLIKHDKSYLAQIKLGATSSTDDEEGVKQVVPVTLQPTRKEIEGVVEKFRGEILQTPPDYSAIKIKGKAAYRYSRAGQSVALTARPVSIHKLTILNYKYPDLNLSVETGPGVYIRSLARDIGKALGTGAYLSGLTRTRVGQYTLEKAITLEDFRMQEASQRHDHPIHIPGGTGDGIVGH